MEKVIETLEKKLFHLLKANPEECDFLANSSEKMAMTIRSEKIPTSFSQKLLGIHITAKISFDEHVKILCRRAY